MSAALKQAAQLAQALRNELMRRKVTSLPQKLQLMKALGLASIDEATAWMAATAREFESAAEDFINDHEAEPQQEPDKLDAERWRETLMRVGATRTEWVGGGYMFIVNLKPPSNVMQGSVAQHFTAAIDAAIGEAQL